MAATFISSAGAIWWCLAVALLLLTLCCGLAQPFVQKRRATAAAQLPVSAILPIKSLDPGFEIAQASMFAQSHSDYEVLISAAEVESPALRVARRVAAAHPSRPCRFIHSDSRVAVSPKLNNLVAPLTKAKHDIVLTKDSNITLDPQTMTAFLQNLAPGVGLVVGIPVAVRPETFAGQIEACLINSHARLLLSASVLGFGFGVGKMMLFRRSDFDRVGGVPAISGNLAEDTAISVELARLGLKTVFAHRTITQEIGPRRLSEVFHRQVRWSVIRRANVLFYPLEPLASPLPAACAAALASPLAGYSALAAFCATLAGWFCAETAFAAAKGWDISIWSPLSFLGREGLSLAAWLRGWTTHQVIWASNRFDARQGPASISQKNWPPEARVNAEATGAIDRSSRLR
ncbi:ceramide glucosyltransferase [Methylocella silvestris BL2]|uniref:Ceramide glucosyltransferase n=1 Tax=Methylocella silvestris (strain DSM 15510 / CIP 108128 / LMG 27833 / NCIMB 13906 / BL2) TaxID=395965 RepID=B8EHX0_METSB|nr:glycosyltransferase [Methylocella silvestris]ACK50452.1 ceramide glucosyltransferase [Methylocella silvestris BL2]